MGEYVTRHHLLLFALTYSLTCASVCAWPTPLAAEQGCQSSTCSSICVCICICAWHVHGMCMACAWHVHGVCMARACIGPSLETRVYSAGPLPEPLLEDQRLQAAVQICFGEADPWTPPARVRALERFRSVRSVVGLPGVGHCPHDEAPELVNSMIVDFVRSLNVEAKAAA